MFQAPGLHIAGGNVGRNAGVRAWWFGWGWGVGGRVGGRGGRGSSERNPNPRVVVE